MSVERRSSTGAPREDALGMLDYGKFRGKHEVS